MARYQLVHDMPGRLRVRLGRYAFDHRTGQLLVPVLSSWPMVRQVEVNERTGSLLFYYDATRKEALLECLDALSLSQLDDTAYQGYLDELASYEKRQKAIFRQYRGQLIRVGLRYMMTKMLPLPLQYFLRCLSARHYLKKGMSSLLAGHLDVPVLDATSITLSLLSQNMQTAGHIMLLLSISALLEDYTRDKTTLSLTEKLSLQTEKVWVKDTTGRHQIASNQLQRGDIVIVSTGAMVPVDGEIISGEAMVNEASFTGEPLSKRVGGGQSVFAGTVVEEGEIEINTREIQQDSRIQQIISLIETNSQAKAAIQAKAEHLADAIVPYSFIGFLGTLFFTRSLSRAMSLLLVDYSCAIKLSTSVAMISAMQEASRHRILVKGGKYIEAMAQADVIVFDKTGTLTHACPHVQQVVGLGQYSREEVLSIAACLEEHFPHSMANAIVTRAASEGLIHEERHAKVEYIIAHGIASSLDGQRVVIGSSHFVFEDEKIPLTVEVKLAIDQLEREGASSLIYLAIGGQLAGIISIDDPLKQEARSTLVRLRQLGFKKIVMLTGDGRQAASHIASLLEVDDYRYEILPEDKAQYIQELKSQGHVVVMVGDGVNDTPALSSADVSISMQDSSAIARELADVTLLDGRLEEIAVFRSLALELMRRIHLNYAKIVTMNSALIFSGMAGWLPATTGALLHNTSTFVLTALATQPLLKDETS